MTRSWMGRLFLVTVFAVPFTAGAQTPASEAARHAVYIEAYGNTLAGSVNYEHRIERAVWLRVGLSPCEVSVGEGCFDRHPARGYADHGVITVTGSRFFRHSSGAPEGLEVGVGMTFDLVDLGFQPFIEPFWPYLTGVLGFRYQPAAGGVVFRVGLTPFVTLGRGFQSLRGTLRFGGMSLGYAF